MDADEVVVAVEKSGPAEAGLGEPPGGADVESVEDEVVEVGRELEWNDGVDGALGVFRSCASRVADGVGVLSAVGGVGGPPGIDGAFGRGAVEFDAGWSR